MSSFSIDASCDRSSLRLACAGELDAGTCPVLDEAVQAHVAVGASLVVVDLAEVTFIDSCAIASLVRASAALAEAGGRLEVQRPSRIVRRAFEMCGLLSVLERSDAVPA